MDLVGFVKMWLVESAAVVLSRYFVVSFISGTMGTFASSSVILPSFTGKTGTRE